MALHELTPVAASLEQAFMALTDGSVEYAAAPADSPTTHHRIEAR